ncbi:hypothetical protein BV22DRAFT_1127130 [Leucogyrophana mollusca]|uniref:Uncharacterized protein n=1 Tax=Leucogyrophana mollusca TaxID=85980 RepID=A0ACB8BT79_9AGAM|nr:hypothetical protein BV22DRAFT_1127130 [Leucogyrophana mollusca]
MSSLRQSNSQSDIGSHSRDGFNPSAQKTQVQPPSEVAPSTRIDTAPQQASTSPGDGAEVHQDQIRDISEVDTNDSNINVVMVPGGQQKPSFKDQVFGYAKVVRGTTLRKPEVKEHGEQVLRGEDAPRRRDSQ